MLRGDPPVSRGVSPSRRLPGSPRSDPPAADGGMQEGRGGLTDGVFFYLGGVMDGFGETGG